MEPHVTNFPKELRGLFPFASKFLTVAGQRMHYIDEGEGPVVVLLHGNPTWSFYYRELIEQLKGTFRVIAPDFIGLGLSDRTPSTRYRAKDRIDQLQEFLEKLEIENFSLVMHDWGGSIGTGLAIRFPERIDRIVYLNTTLTETEALPPLIKIAATPLIGKFLTQITKQFLRFTTVLGVSHKLPKAVRAGYYAPYKSISSRKAIWDFVDDIPFDARHPSYKTMMELAENIHRLAAHEVQIIWGLADPCFHREMLTKVARHFPSAEIIELADASHLVLEDAREIALPAIQGFLQNGPGHYQNSEAVNVPLAVGEPHGESVLLDSFHGHCKKLGNKPAVIEPLFIGEQVRYGHTSFREMRDRICKYERGLTELGLEPGDRVVMLVPPGADFLALTYAFIARAAIPVFSATGMGKENLFKAIRDINPHVLIGSPRAQLLRLKRRELMPELKFHVTASDWVYTGGPKLSYLKRFSSKPLSVPKRVSDTVFIAFTSGATGRPKGVLYTNQMLRAQLQILRDQFGICEGKRDLPLLPVFSLFHLANGVCSVFPNVDPSRPISLSPERIVKIVNDLEVNYSFGSPTLWKKIADYAVRAKQDFPSLEKIFMAGAPVSSEVSERVQELLPHGAVYTPYGATEALPVTLSPVSELKSGRTLASGPSSGLSRCGNQGLCVGTPIDGVRVLIVDRKKLRDERAIIPVGIGEIGEILVSGENVSKEYFQNVEANTSSKFSFDDAHWHRVGDVGYQDESGRLYYCGRVAHVVETTEQTYYSVPTEMIFNTMPKVRRSALVGLGAGENPGVVVEPNPEFWPENDESRRLFLAELESIAAQYDLTRKIRWFFFHPNFPVDGRHNAKIFRDQLSQWARKYVVKQEAA
ncbi:MAG: fatty acid CoA ligase family protein [Bdellovibrionota bacterium]